MNKICMGEKRYIFWSSHFNNKPRTTYITQKKPKQNKKMIISHTLTDLSPEAIHEEEEGIRKGTVFKTYRMWIRYTRLINNNNNKTINRVNVHVKSAIHQTISIFFLVYLFLFFLFVFVDKNIKQILFKLHETNFLFILFLLLWLILFPLYLE